jgi:hypothetical protein
MGFQVNYYIVSLVLTDMLVFYQEKETEIKNKREKRQFD